jgi:hypothetical protein
MQNHHGHRCELFNHRGKPEVRGNTLGRSDVPRLQPLVPHLLNFDASLFLLQMELRASRRETPCTALFEWIPLRVYEKI